MNPIAPCKDCTDRYPGCHSKCTKYIKWNMWHIAIKNKQYQEELPDKIFAGFVIEAKIKEAKFNKRNRMRSAYRD